MIEMNTPCRDCTSRLVGCHSMCSDYKAYKAELQRIKDNKDKERQFEKYVATNIGKAKKIKNIRNYGLND